MVRKGTKNRIEGMKRQTCLGEEVGGGAVKAGGLLVHEEGPLLMSCVWSLVVGRLILVIEIVVIVVGPQNHNKHDARHGQVRTWMKSSREVMAEKMIM